MPLFQGSILVSSINTLPCLPSGVISLLHKNGMHFGCRLVFMSKKVIHLCGSLQKLEKEIFNATAIQSAQNVHPQVPAVDPFQSLLPYNASNDEFQPFAQAASPQKSTTATTQNLGLSSETMNFDFNPSFALFDSLNSTSAQPSSGGGSHNLSYNGACKATANQPTQAAQAPQNSNLDLFSSFNPFESPEITSGNADQPQQQTNPFLLPTSAAFWDDPIITGLVDLNIGRGKYRAIELKMKNSWRWLHICVVVITIKPWMICPRGHSLVEI